MRSRRTTARFHLTGAEALDSRQFDTLLAIGPDVTPLAVITDKGYDAKANREAARTRGTLPVFLPLERQAAAKVLPEEVVSAYAPGSKT